MVHVRLEEGKRDANLPHDVSVVVARPFLHATTGPCHFLRRVLSLCSSHAASYRSAPRHIRHHPTIAIPGRESTFFTMFLSLFQEGARSWMWYLRCARTTRETTTGTGSLTRSFRAETVIALEHGNAKGVKERIPSRRRTPKRLLDLVAGEQCSLWTEVPGRTFVSVPKTVHQGRIHRFPLLLDWPLIELH